MDVASNKLSLHFSFVPRKQIVIIQSGRQDRSNEEGQDCERIFLRIQVLQSNLVLMLNYPQR